MEVILNDFMIFPRKFTTNEINMITSKLTNCDISLLTAQTNTLDFYIAQLKYPSIRRLDDDNLIFIGSIDEFIIDRDTKQFYIKEYDYDGTYEDITIFDFDNIYDKIFHASYYSKNNDIVNVSNNTRAIYKLLAVIETYFNADLIMYPLNRYLNEHTANYKNYLEDISKQTEQK